MAGITELLGLICTLSSETFSAMVKKPCYRYLNHLKFLASIGSFSETGITAQAVGARDLKLNEGSTGKGMVQSLQLVEVVVCYS